MEMEQETYADSVQRLSNNLGLLSVQLQALLRDAEDQKWAFIPETWQFEDRVGEQDIYNVKDLITAPSTQRPGKTEADILWECADLAVECKSYPRAVAILFLLDRYAFWQGTSPRLLKAIDDIRQNSPSTPVPPQIVIRKARVLTNAGDLQGAERVLDDVLSPDKEKGQWYDASTLILDSIIGFRMLPKPDKKGIASSVGLLMDVFKNISYRDFQILKQQYTLQADSPLLEAYRAAEEAAHLSKYDPLFCARHRRRAGEVLILCAQQIQDDQEKEKFLQLARTNLSESLHSHESVEALRSREQLCEFICASFQSCQVLEMTGAVEKSNNLTKMCMHLYEEYCAVETNLSLTSSMKRMIDLIMEVFETLLSTSQLQETVGGNNTDLAKETTLSYSLSINHIVPNDHTTQRQPGEENNPQTVDENGKKSGTVDSGFDTTEDEDRTSDYNKSTVDPSATTIDLDEANSAGKNVPKDNICSSSTVDPSATTVDQTKAKWLQPPTEVDRLCRAVDKHHIQASTVDPSMTTLGLTVDPSATTVDVAYEKVGSDENIGVGKDETSLSHVGDSRHERKMSAEEQKKWNEMFADLSPVTRVHKALLHKYDPFNDRWESENTLVYLGDPLLLSDDKKGKQRDAFFVQYISQEEAMGRYVGKRYKKDKPYEQYRQDVCCQMTARKYVTVFNHKLRHQQAFGQIQYLPAVTLQVNPSQPESFTINVEPYIDGDFVKLTNNLKYKHPVLDSGLATAFTHFTYEASGQKLMIVDIQGWTTVDGRGVTYFTDPQIHSEEIKKYGRGNLGDRGVQAFWREQHPRCNKVCRLLKLKRPLMTS
ncbi:alpha-protein kinase 1-like isoform X2 [Branchiostoma floridae]|uniref:Alpha-protein kinase 1-like isoform X2 n=1 Tax=Branchiostoma floridae TaxID=7739 RepID=A0A9J7KWU0_BRAFL|nr:alpha-protein kinase 1-like isoform X2 [Branchiostoma floridae]